MVIERRFGSAIIYGVIVLIAVQAGRAAVFFGLSRLFGSTVLPPIAMRAAVYCLVSAGFCLIAHPQAGTMGFRLPASGFFSRGGTILFGALWILAIGSSATFGWSMFLENFVNALIIPLAEEALFRGFLWGTIEESWSVPKGDGTPRRGGVLISFASTSVLFALFHLGYVDMVAVNMPAGENLAFVMGMKVLIGLCVGLLAGAGRAVSKSVWLPIFLHGLWNVFGR